MRRSTERAAGSIDHPTSWPWVLATTLVAPARRAAGASRPSGAAAPNHTVSIACSAMSRLIRAATRGVGSIRVPGWRTTRYPASRSNSCAPFQCGA